VVVRLAALRGDLVCPNYFLSERALELRERNLFTAHELVQMVPLHGLAVYHRMRALNRWTERFLPNAAGPPRPVNGHERRGGFLCRTAEIGLSSPLGGRLERFEQTRKVRRFGARSNSSEADFSADWCKGHFDDHGQHTLRLLAERLRRFDGVAG
jgi:hypothetical protein